MRDSLCGSLGAAAEGVPGPTIAEGEVSKPMRIHGARNLAALGAAACVCLLAVALGSSAQAQPKSKSVQTEAEWLSFDAESSTVTVKVKKPGRGKAAKGLRRGKEATFKVKPEGSVMTRTTVAVNGRKGELADIPKGKTVNIYWIPDDKDQEARFARKIDVIFSEAELEARSTAE